MGNADKERHDRFAELFVDNERRLYRFIVTLVPNRADADELLGRTNLTLWKTWDRYDHSRDFLRWACGIAHNEIRNFLRSRQDHSLTWSNDLLDELAEQRLLADDLLEQRQTALSACLEKLSPHQKELVEQCYAPHRSIKDVAQSRGWSPDAVYKAVQRVRTVLFDCINRTMTAKAEL